MAAKAVVFIAAGMSPVGKVPSSSERASFKLVNTMMDPMMDNCSVRNEEDLRTFELWWR